MNGPVTAAVVEEHGSVSVSGDRLDPLVHRVRLSGSEWRVVIAVLLHPGPVSARQLAKRLRLAYSSVKRVVRGLVAWNILLRTREGLTLQNDSTRWASPRGGGRQ
jgi:predicted ArsR family transcriptional regulator